MTMHVTVYVYSVCTYAKNAKKSLLREAEAATYMVQAFSAY